MQDGLPISRNGQRTAVKQVQKHNRRALNLDTWQRHVVILNPRLPQASWPGLAELGKIKNVPHGNKIKIRRSSSLQPSRYTMLTRFPDTKTDTSDRTSLSSFAFWRSHVQVLTRRTATQNKVPVFPSSFIEMPEQTRMRSQSIPHEFLIH